ncbi:hypothetical protein COL940_010627 [Colletotrichum noveboracense]|nr:hypothetical protein COL940_010627 [Colletotrichum noveboracense]
MGAGMYSLNPQPSARHTENSSESLKSQPVEPPSFVLFGKRPQQPRTPPIANHNCGLYGPLPRQIAARPARGGDMNPTAADGSLPAPAGERSKNGENVTASDDDPKPWQLKHGRALVLRTNGDLQEATDLLREVVQDLKHSLGSENIETLTAIQNLAIVRLDLGDTDVAATLFESVLSTAGRVFGEEHAFTTLSKANLASVRVRQGRLDEAEDLQRDVLRKTQEAVRETHSDASPDAHPDILEAKASLANTLRYKGESAESGILLEGVYKTTAEAFDADAPETIGATSDYANWLQDRGRVDEADPMFERVLEDAEALLRQSYDILNQSEGSRGLEKIIAGNHLNTIIFSLSLDRRDHKRLEEAVHLHETLVAAACSTLGYEHPLTKNAMTEFDRMAEILRKVAQ